MAISYGPNLGLLYNANIDEQYYDAFRLFLQGIDAVLLANVLSAALTNPPGGPNGGDAYLLVGTPTGAWAGHQFSIAVWDAQYCPPGSNNPTPQWNFYAPQNGWRVFDVATVTPLVWNGSAWVSSALTVPLPVNEGGTGGTSETTARTSLGIAATGLNEDITSLTLIAPDTIGSPSACPLYIHDANLGGSDEAQAFLFNNTRVFGGLVTTGVWFLGGLICTGPYTAASFGGGFGSGISNCNEMLGPTGQPVTFGVTGGSSTFNVGTNGTNTPHEQLFGLTGQTTQTTVGVTGSASALPATPVGYAPIFINGTEVVVPYYNAT
jgi:hypothetical protein